MKTGEDPVKEGGMDMQFTARALALGAIVLVTGCGSDDGGTVASTDTGTAADTATSSMDTATATDTATTTETSGETTGETSSDAAKKALGETCAVDGDCASNACFVGGMGSYCSLKCTTENAATVCIAPLLPECNIKGYCKKA
jgi:hypothetical protein